MAASTLRGICAGLRDQSTLAEVTLADIAAGHQEAGVGEKHRSVTRCGTDAFGGLDSGLQKTLQLIAYAELALRPLTATLCPSLHVAWTLARGLHVVLQRPLRASITHFLGDLK